MERIWDVLIIGGGPAGYTAALYAARAGWDTVVLERFSAGGQMTLTGIIENYPGFPEGTDGFSLGRQMQAGAEQFGAVTDFSAVTAVEVSGKIKKAATVGGTFCAKTVIIATGADPRSLGVAGEAALVGKGVHYCAHCDGGFYRDKTVAVVGGGNTAAGDALYLAKLASRVILIHRRDSLRAELRYRRRIADTENITFLPESVVTGFLSDGGFRGLRVKRTGEGREVTIPCDGVVVSVGRIPATRFLSDSLPLDAGGYIVADESTKTACPGVYAAGDVRTKELRQVVTAVSDGAMAAYHAGQFLAGY